MMDDWNPIPPKATTRDFVAVKRADYEALRAALAAERERTARLRPMIDTLLYEVEHVSYDHWNDWVKRLQAAGMVVRAALRETEGG